MNIADLAAGVPLEHLPTVTCTTTAPVPAGTIRSPNLARIAEAESFYTGRGYEPTAAAWVISEAAMSATLPPGVPAWAADHGALVGSAEQSFVERMLDGDPPGRAQAWTPCFRHETRHGLFHQPYFVKLELIDTLDSDHAGLTRMVEAAVEFFSRHLTVDVVETHIGLDVVSARARIELGSYGIREAVLNDITYRWAYGTGIAEPRLTAALTYET